MRLLLFGSTAPRFRTLTKLILSMCPIFNDATYCDSRQQPNCLPSKACVGSYGGGSLPDVAPNRYQRALRPWRLIASRRQITSLDAFEPELRHFGRRLKGLTFLCLFCLVVMCSSCGGGGSSSISGGTQGKTLSLNFANPVVYPTGADDARSIAVADVNGDGKLDVVVANNCSSGNCFSGAAVGSVSVLLGNGDGTFQTAVVFESGGGGATSVAVADVNGDGKPDLLVANFCATTSNCANGTLSVLLGNGNGTFRPPVAYNSGGSLAVSLAVADVNGDGKPDVVVANCTNCGSLPGNGSVGVLLGNGDGTFQAAQVFTTGEPSAVAIADVNGDKKPDVIVAQCVSPVFGCVPGQVGVLLGNGDGTFQTIVTYGTAAANPNSVVVADVNGDGKLDLVVGNASGTAPHGGGDGAAAVLLGNGDGTFQPAVIYPAGGDPQTGETLALAVADVNNDGKLDLVLTDTHGACTDPNQSTVTVLLGKGDGTFQSAVGYCSGGLGADSIAVADVNGDGKPDLLVANSGTASSSAGQVGVLLNSGTIMALSLPASDLYLALGCQYLGASGQAEWRRFTAL